MMKNLIYLSLFLLLSGLTFTSCDKNKNKQEISKGKINLLVEHSIHGLPVEFDKLIYVNEAGNKFLLSEIQWFISDIKLHKSDGTVILIGDDGGEYYVDSDIAASLSINPEVEIEVGDYTGLSFTFGINDKKNKSHRFVNPPESFYVLAKLSWRRLSLYETERQMAKHFRTNRTLQFPFGNWSVL